MMRRLFVFGAVAIVLVFAILRVAGADAHASIISGQPISNASYYLGPAYVASYLAAVVVAPILALAAAIETLLRRVKIRSS